MRQRGMEMAESTKGNENDLKDTHNIPDGPDPSNGCLNAVPGTWL